MSNAKSPDKQKTKRKQVEGEGEVWTYEADEPKEHEPWLFPQIIGGYKASEIPSINQTIQSQSVSSSASQQESLIEESITQIEVTPPKKSPEMVAVSPPQDNIQTELLVEETNTQIADTSPPNQVIQSPVISPVIEHTSPPTEAIETETIVAETIQIVETVDEPQAAPVPEPEPEPQVEHISPPKESPQQQVVETEALVEESITQVADTSPPKESPVITQSPPKESSEIEYRSPQVEIISVAPHFRTVKESICIEVFENKSSSAVVETLLVEINTEYGGSSPQEVQVSEPSSQESLIGEEETHLESISPSQSPSPRAPEKESSPPLVYSPPSPPPSPPPSLQPSPASSPPPSPPPSPIIHAETSVLTSSVKETITIEIFESKSSSTAAESLIVEINTEHETLGSPESSRSSSISPLESTRLSSQDMVAQTGVQTGVETGVRLIDQKDVDAFIIYYSCKLDKLFPKAVLYGRLEGEIRLNASENFGYGTFNGEIIVSILRNEDIPRMRDAASVQHSNDLIKVAPRDKAKAAIYGEKLGGFIIGSDSVLLIRGLLSLHQRDNTLKAIRGGCHLVEPVSGMTKFVLHDANLTVLLWSEEKNWVINDESYLDVPSARADQTHSRSTTDEPEF